MTSSPAGINCGATCTAQFTDGTSVTLTATPTPGSGKGASSFFSGWSGCDSTNGSQCTVALASDRTVTATFGLMTFSLSW